jgi:hypothetical protein
MQYLVTGEFIDPGPLLPPDQLCWDAPTSDSSFA